VVNVGRIPSYYFSVHSYRWYIGAQSVISLASVIVVSNPYPFGNLLISAGRYYRKLSSRERNITAWLVADVHNIVADYCSCAVNSALHTVLGYFSLDIFQAAWAQFVLVGASFGWCKIVSWLGASFTRSHHDLSAIEVVWSGHTSFSVPELEATYALL
jgi:hypothetical protein